MAIAMPNWVVQMGLFGDVNNCGDCGRSCGQNSICVNGVCGCPEGFADCNNRLADGCEANLSNSSDHRGVCKKACKDKPVWDNKQCVCENATCVPKEQCVSSEGADCNIDTNPCCESLACVTIFKDQKDSRCYKDCTNDHSVCTSTQKCIVWMQS